MAWNEPGGNNKDPWNNRKDEQGPPDLDEVFKKLFGKIGGSGNNGNNKSAGIGVGLVLAIALIVWGFSGFYTIREAERGVLLTFGKFTEYVEPGLRWKATFIQEVKPIDVRRQRSMTSQGFMLTEDENLVSVEMEIQYRVIDPFKFVYSVTQPEDSLNHALDSAIRYVVGHSEMDSVLTSGKEVARQRVWEELQKIIEPYDIGVEIMDVNFRNARPPEQVKAAFDDAIAAQEDEVRLKREAEAYARAIEPEARGRVNRMLQEAEAYKQRVTLEAEGEVARFASLLPQYQAAPEVTRQRLYLETLEQVYSNTSKIMVDSQGSGNMMYLPLDKILERQNTSQNQSAPLSDTQSTIDALRSNSQNNTRTQPGYTTGSNDRIRSGRGN